MFNFFMGRYGPIKGLVIFIALCFAGIVWTVSTMGGRFGMAFFFTSFLGAEVMMYLFIFSTEDKHKYA